MIELIDLKHSSILKLKEFFLNSESCNKDMYFLDIQIGEVDLISIAKYLNSNRIFYFKNNNFEILGTESIFYEENKLNYRNLETLINENPKLYAFNINSFKAKPVTDNLPNSFVNIPMFSIIRKNSDFLIRFNLSSKIMTSKVEQMNYLMKIEKIFSFKISTLDIPNRESFVSIPGQELWNKSIETAKKLFNKTFSKIVLSRKIINIYDQQLDPLSFLNTEEQLNNYIYFFKLNPSLGFVSYSPEKLFEIKGKEIILDSIAGTIKRGKSEKEDQKLSNQLLNDKKEIGEHRIVTNSITEQLKNLNLDPVIIKKETILKQKFIQHIHTLISAKHNGLSPFNLLNRFHPTPAVGGHPRKDALEYIEKLEAYDRGYYSAPMGLLNKENTIYIVAIRSALIDGNKLNIYAGAGIVPDSIADNEWNETANKMRKFINE